MDRVHWSCADVSLRGAGTQVQGPGPITNILSYWFHMCYTSGGFSWSSLNSCTSLDLWMKVWVVGFVGLIYRCIPVCVDSVSCWSDWFFPYWTFSASVISVLSCCMCWSFRKWSPYQGPFIVLLSTWLQAIFDNQSSIIQLGSDSVVGGNALVSSCHAPFCIRQSPWTVCRERMLIYVEGCLFLIHSWYVVA